MNYKRGKDISRHQGDVDMERLADDTDELLMRGTLGSAGVDDRFAEYWRESGWAGIPTRCIYHLPIVNVPWWAQYENIMRVTQGDFGNGRYTFDYEMRAIDIWNIQHGWRWPKEQFTADMFELYQALKREGPVGFRAYGNKGTIDGMFTLDRAWLLEMELHIAAYPWTRLGVTYEELHALLHAGTYDIAVPYPWSTLPPEMQIAVWQGAYTGRAPGIAGNVDLNLIFAPTEMEAPMFPMPKGTLYGAHGESGNQIIPLIDRYRAHGANLAVVLAVENPGLCVDAKARGVPLTIARWKNPNDTYEGGGAGVHTWTTAMRHDFATRAIQMIFDRCNDAEYAGSDFFTPGLNEWDHQEPAGWTAAGEVLCLLCDEATRRSPEKTSKGAHPIRLAIPGFNNGTPKTYAMYEALAATGLFAKMKARGDLLIFHEGVWWDEPINQGHGDVIPGAPVVPGAGSKCFRSDYLMHLLRQRGEEVLYVIGEWYDGNRRETPNHRRLAAMQWYDRELRKRPHARGFCVFELTDMLDSTWRPVDFTPVFQSDEMLADMAAEKDKPNPTEGEDDMATKVEIIARLDAASGEIAAARALANSLPDAPPWWQKATPYTFRAAPVNPLRLYRPDRVTVGASLNYTGWEITVAQVDAAGWLKVVDPAGDANDLWLRAGDVQPA